MMAVDWVIKTSRMIGRFFLLVEKGITKGVHLVFKSCET